MSRIARNQNLPEGAYKPLCAGKKFISMSERVRMYTDEGFPLDMLGQGQTSYDLVDSVDVDLNVDFHLGFMEQAEIALHKAAEPARKVEDKKDLEPTLDSEPTE